MRKEAFVSDGSSFIEIMHQLEDYQDSSDMVKTKHAVAVQYRIGSLASRPLDKITRAELLKWRSELSKTEYSTQIKNEAVQLVRSVFRFGSEIYGYPDNGVILKRFRKTNGEAMHEMAVWTPEQFQQFLNAIPPEEYIYYVYFEMLFWTGMRRGEGAKTH
jgi:integrase